MSKQIIPEAFKWLNATGLNILEEKFYIRGYIMIFIMTSVGVLEILQLCFNFSNIDILVGVIEVLAPVYLSLIKIIMMFMQRKTLSSINSHIDAFWSTGKFGREIRAQLERIFVIVKTMLQGYRWLAITTTTMIVSLKPILTGKGGFPIDIWQPMDLYQTPYYQITYFLQCCVGYYASFINIAIDSLFVGYMMHLISQFIMLRHAFKSLDMNYIDTDADEDKCWMEMKTYIEYHNHLLSVIAEIQKSHSMAFFNIFGTGTLCICIDLYSVAYDDGTLDILRIIKYIFQCSFFVFLLFAYCFTGNQLTLQCLAVSDDMYESDWYVKPLPKIRRGVSLVILRGQIETKLNAGGFVTLDLENFVRMLRMAFSFFTLIRTQAEKKANL